MCYMIKLSDAVFEKFIPQPVLTARSIITAPHKLDFQYDNKTQCYTVSRPSIMHSETQLPPFDDDVLNNSYSARALIGQLLQALPSPLQFSADQLIQLSEIEPEYDCLVIAMILANPYGSITDICSVVSSAGARLSYFKPITTRELAMMFNVNISTARRWCDDEKICAEKSDSEWQISIYDAIRFEPPQRGRSPKNA